MKSLKQLVKDCLYMLLTFLHREKGNYACIYMYHSVGDSGAMFTVKRGAFEQQINFLIRKNYSVLKLSELIHRLEAGESIAKTVCITFDDGYIDNYEVVFPLLKKYNVPISLFLTTGLVGKEMTNSEGITLPFVSEAQIREMQESGLVEFLPHGAHHKKLHAVKKEDARKEILESFMDLEKLLRSAPKIFAYPSGRYTNETIEVLSEESFIAAVTVQPGLVRQGISMYELPRNHVDSTTSFAEFVARLSPAGEWYEKLKGKTKV